MQGVVQWQHVRFVECEGPPKRPVSRVAERHDAGKAVEPAAKQHEDEACLASHLGEMDDGKPKRGEAAKAHGANEAAAIHVHLH